MAPVDKLERYFCPDYLSAGRFSMMQWLADLLIVAVGSLAAWKRAQREPLQIAFLRFLLSVSSDY